MKDIITGKKIKPETDKEALLHSDYCFVKIIKFHNRTIYSCKCSEKENYLKNFNKNRNNGL